MRSLRKDKRKIYASKRLPSIPILDSERNPTGEYAKAYEIPTMLNLNAKPVTDLIEQQIFGEDSEHILKIIYTPFDSKKIVVSQYDAIWIDVEPNGILNETDPQHPMNNNYIVIKTINLGNQNAAFIKKTSGDPQ